MQKFLKFNPIYKEKIWGGRKLASLGRNLPDGKIGESWEISDFENDLSIIANGDLKGTTLRECFKKYKTEIFGQCFKNDEGFPLLIKIIDANDKLSVQVHPDNEYAKNFDPMSKGKKECWFILNAEDRAEIVCGFSKEVSREEYSNLINNNQAEFPLYYRKVKKGDTFLIEPGTVHAIGSGNLILEIQQSSDSTYRVYDYGRLGDDGKPRALHLKKALDVLNFKKSTDSEVLKEHLIAKDRYLLTSNDKFRIEKIKISGEFQIPNMFKEPSFHILSVLDGKITIEETILNIGDTILITALGILEGLSCTASEHTEFALIGCGTDWLEPSI